MYMGLQVKYLLFLSDLHETWIFLTDFFKTIQISDIMKMHPVGAETFHTEGQTDRHDEANSCILQFCKRA